MNANKSTRFIWKSLDGNSELQERYAVKVRNNFQILEQESATEMYKRFINAVNETAQESIEVAPKRKRDRPFSENKRIKQAREDTEIAYQKFVGSDGRAVDTYIESKRNLDKIYEELFGKDLDKKIEEIRNATVTTKRHRVGD
jgi:hypothetical protein